jgi:HTH-type transcriptional regulator/antitoxin HigA
MTPQPRPIHDDAENARATGMLEKLSALEHPTPEQEAVAEILVTLIEAYEERYRLAAASPLEILLELMAANDCTQKEIAAIVGSKGVTSEVLRGRRPISKGMAEKLAARFKVPHTLFL